MRFLENLLLLLLLLLLLFCSDADDVVLEDCRLNSIQLFDRFDIEFEFV